MLCVISLLYFKVEGVYKKKLFNFFLFEFLFNFFLFHFVELIVGEVNHFWKLLIVIKLADLENLENCSVGFNNVGNFNDLLWFL